MAEIKKQFVSEENLQEYHNLIKTNYESKKDAQALETSLTQKISTKADSSSVYTKAETSSKEEITQAISTAINGIEKLTRKTATEEQIQGYQDAPDTAQDNVIYMVKDEDVLSGDQYKEYMKIDNQFVQIGDTSVDLEPYAKTADLNIYARTADLNSPDRAQEGQYVSSVSQENGKITVTRADLPDHTAEVEKAVQAGLDTITDGETNGTFKVGEKAINIGGLKGAAYQDTDYFATAAQGTKADSALQPEDITALTTGFTNDWFIETE